MSGELDTEGSLLIKGKFTGVVRSVSHISIDKSAWVESCSLSAESVSVSGRFSGSIKVSGCANFQDRARISASVECASLKISSSCRFEGTIAMPDLALRDLRLNKPSLTADRSSGN
jgi:cytoskeletal protein CcmA (bactofilin family)